MQENISPSDLFPESYTCHIWNIKILPSIQGIYNDLFPYASTLEGIKTKGKNEIRIISINTNIQDLIYGELVLYSKVKHIDMFNAEAKEVEHASIKDNYYLYPKIARFFFVPSKHRLCIEKRTGLNMDSIRTYLQGLLSKYIEHKEISNEHTAKIELETSPTYINNILSFRDIWRVETRISFTNDDFTKDFAKLIDDSGKDSGATTMTINASSETSQPLQIRGTLLEGALELAQSNGDIVIHRGSPDKRRQKKYSTATNPRTEQFNESSEELPHAIRHFILDMLKDNNNDN